MTDAELAAIKARGVMGERPEDEAAIRALIAGLEEAHAELLAWATRGEDAAQRIERLVAELRKERKRFAELWRIDMIHLGQEPEWPEGYEDVTEGETP